jgi:hypothetical protein
LIWHIWYGPWIDLAIALIDRMKLFVPTAGNGNGGNGSGRSSAANANAIIFDTKETVLELNGVKIEAFPSHHLDAMQIEQCSSL